MRRFNFPTSAKKAVSLTCMLALTSLLVVSLQAGAQTAGAVQAREGAPSSGPQVRLEGHVAHQILEGKATRLEHYSPEQMLRVVLAVKPPHMDQEEQLVKELVTKGSPNFHKFLTVAEWNARFAPSAEDEQKVVDWAVSQGMTVTKRYSHRLLVNVEAPSGVMEKAFGVTINKYQLGNEVDFANENDPSLPESLSNIVYSVQGLNNIQRDHGSRPGPEDYRGPDYAAGPEVLLAGAKRADADPEKAISNIDPNIVARPLITNNRIDPSDLANSNIYNYSGLQALSHCCNVHNDSTGSPAVSSIAVAGFGNFLDSDIAGFASTYGMAYNYTYYYVAGTPGCSSSSISPPCATGETTEDIEYSIGFSNSFGSANDTAHEYIYLGGNQANSTYTTIYGDMLSDDTARVMTTSYSCTENYECPTTTMDARHAIFVEMVGAGWTLIAASGDRGAADDCKDNLPAKPAPQLDPDAHTSVAFPASDWDVVAAGGTQLGIYTNGDWNGENAWQGGFGIGSCASNGGGSGGGVSTYYGQPSWQSSLSSLGSMRLSPDISLNAAGVAQNLYINGALDGDANGTSVVAPELAGFFAQENTYLNYIGNICGKDGTTACTPVGLPTPFIYGDAIGGAPHDPFYNILSGCNSSDATQQDGLSFFCAGPGFSLDTNQGTQYNLVSGWGSTNMMQLAWGINWELIPAYGSPSVAFSGPATSTWYNTNQTVNWTVSDAGSGGLPAPGVAGFTQGWDSIPADAYSEPHGGTGNSFYSGPEFPFGTTGCLAFEANGCSGGVSQGCHTVQVEGWDNQGNTAYGSYGPLCYDTVAPTISVSTSPATSFTTWVNKADTVTLTSSDPGGSGASGIYRTYYAINTGVCTPSTIDVCGFYTGPITISTPGQSYIYYFTEDNAGNFSGETYQWVSIDLSTPVTKAALSGTVYSGSTYDSNVNIALTATDSGGSGIAATYYKLDGGAAVQYTGSIPVSALGGHTILYWSVNGAGTTEGTNTLSFTIDSLTTASLVATPNPSVNGQSVTMTATIKASLSGTPTGSVIFYNGSTNLGTVTLSGGIATLATTALPVGALTLQVSYAGSGNFIATNSAPFDQTVQETTTVAVTPSANPAIFGSSLTLTATVKPSISGIPTGSVSFYAGSMLLGTSTLNGSAVATLATTALPVGSNSITAVYSGDALDITSTSAAFNETITKAPSSIAVVSSGNPSAYDQPVTFTATVTSAYGIPTGTVTFFSGTTSLGSATLTGGIATVTTSALALGTDSITATYAATTDYTASTSVVLSQVINQAATFTALVSSLNPSAYDQAVKLTATVTATYGTPTGTVTFLSNGLSIGTGSLSGGVATLTTSALAVGTDSVTANYSGSADYTASTATAVSQVVNQTATTTGLSASPSSSTYGESVTFTAKVFTANGTPTGTVTFQSGGVSIGSGTLSGSIATLATSTLPAGTDTVTAVYGGSADYSGSTSNTATQYVGKATTSTALVSSLNPSSYAGAVSLTATVTSTYGTPAGAVTFLSNGTSIGAGTLTGGVATLTTSSLAVGTDTITASYTATADYSASTSAPVSQVVNQIATTTALVSSLNPSNYGQSVKLTATVTAASGTPAGAVTFLSAGTSLGAGTLSGGVASFTTSALSVGTNSITAVYTGSVDYSTSTSGVLSQVVNPLATTTGLSASPSISAYDQSVTFTAKVFTAYGTPTGAVTFMSGGNTLGTGTLAGSIATLATTALPVGTDAVTAVYVGSASYTGSTSNTATQYVNKASTTTALVSSLNPSTYDQAVTFTVSVTSAYGTPTGTVTFFSNGASIGTGTLTGGVATLTTSALALGNDSITASYAATASYSASTSVAISQVVSQTATNTTLVSSLNPSAYDQAVKFTATVTALSGTPTGTVTFMSNGTSIGAGTVLGGVATLTTYALAAGTDTITAVYSGSADYSASTSAALSQAVNPLATTTGLSASPSSSTYGESVTFTAKVFTASGTPTGIVTFQSGGVTLGTGTLSGSIATLAAATLPAGTDTVTAVYGGSADYTGSTSNTATQYVSKAATTTTLVSSLNPSNYGQAVSFTVAVTSAYGTPTGTVTFLSNGASIGTGTLTGGVATLTTSALALGTDTITASYAATGDYGASTSAPVTQVVNQVATTTALASSLNPSSYGQAVKLTATVTAASGTPAGAVTFLSNGISIGAGTLSGGVATLSTTALAAGTDSVTASYAGSAGYGVSTSAAVPQVVNQTATTTGVSASPSSSTFGESITITAKVFTAYGTPTGTVTFMSGGTTLGVGTLSASIATLATSALPVGTDSITAVYSGSAGYLGSTSNTATQYVNKAATTTALASSLNPSSAGQSVTFTATVTPANGGTATGTVTFMNGTASLGTATLSGSAATLATTTLPTGTDSITAVYAASADYLASTSAALSQTVNAAATVVRSADGTDKH